MPIHGRIICWYEKWTSGFVVNNDTQDQFTRSNKVRITLHSAFFLFKTNSPTEIGPVHLSAISAMWCRWLGEHWVTRVRSLTLVRFAAGKMLDSTRYVPDESSGREVKKARVTFKRSTKTTVDYSVDKKLSIYFAVFVRNFSTNIVKRSRACTQCWHCKCTFECESMFHWPGVGRWRTQSRKREQGKKRKSQNRILSTSTPFGFARHGTEHPSPRPYAAVWAVVAWRSEPAAESPAARSARWQWSWSAAWLLQDGRGRFSTRGTDRAVHSETERKNTRCSRPARIHRNSWIKIQLAVRPTRCFHPASKVM